jgi:hypothetical protein
MPRKSTPKPVHYSAPTVDNRPIRCELKELQKLISRCVTELAQMRKTADGQFAVGICNLLYHNDLRAHEKA